MPLGLNTFTYAGLTFGDLDIGADVGIMASTGLQGLSPPQRATSATVGARHGSIGGAQWGGHREIVASCWVTDDAMLRNVQAAMAPRIDPQDLLEWRFSGLGHVGERSLYVRPERMNYAVGALAARADQPVWLIDLMWWALDPTIFSDPTDTAYSFSGTTVGHTISNPGTFAAKGIGRALTIELTATGSGCRDPWIDNADHPDERVVFSADMYPAVGISAPANRMVTIGGTLALGALRGANGSWAPGWPTLRPGDNTIRMGAASGTFTATVTTRGTWY